jgi:hypothetical protein
MNPTSPTWWQDTRCFTSDEPEVVSPSSLRLAAARRKFILQKLGVSEVWAIWEGGVRLDG